MISLLIEISMAVPEMTHMIRPGLIRRTYRPSYMRAMPRD